jgi:hypothetical protein
MQCVARRIGYAKSSTHPALLDQLVGTQDKTCRNLKANVLGGLQIDDEFEFARPAKQSAKINLGH